MRHDVLIYINNWLHDSVRKLGSRSHIPFVIIIKGIKRFNRFNRFKWFKNSQIIKQKTRKGGEACQAEGEAP